MFAFVPQATCKEKLLDDDDVDDDAGLTEEISNLEKSTTLSQLFNWVSPIT